MATARQKRAVKKIVENGGIVSKGMREAGYSKETAKTPQKLTESKGWRELMQEYLSDEDLAEKHKQLLNATKVEHMIFPLGPKTRAEQLDTSKMPIEVKTIFDAEQALKQTDLSDDDIAELLASVNCKVRKIVHGETARHVYFWAADNKARKDALDMGYKLKGHYAPEKTDITTLGDKISPNEVEIALIANKAAELLRHDDTNPTATSGA